MNIIYHKDRPLLEFADEPWRPSLRMAVNRSAGATSLSIWLCDFEGERGVPLHWHDVEEVLVFLEVNGEGFVRVGDQEYKIESQTSVVVPPGTIHGFGLHGSGSMKSIAVLPDADAVLGHRVFDNDQERLGLPPLKNK